MMTPPPLLDVAVGFYRRANGKRPWRREPLRVILEMTRTGDLWRAGDGLLAGLTAEAVVRATALEAAWAADVAPAEDGDRGNPQHATFYERKASYSQLKGGQGAETLSGATFSGIYQGCRDSGMECHSGIIVYDLDHLSRQDEVASEVRDRCGHLAYVVFAFISPSGDGVKGGVLVDPVPTLGEGPEGWRQGRREHLAAWEQGRARLMEDLGLPIVVSDAQAKNTSRLCFLGHDPGLYIADPEAVEAVSVDLTTGTPKAAPSNPGAGKSTAAAAAVGLGSGSERPFNGDTIPPSRMRPHPDQWLRVCPWLLKVGGQLQGQCPECGGTDRFHINVETHLWQCRKCHEDGQATWPWYAAFQPWYRPGDFTGPGKHGPWECSPDADLLRLIRRHSDELLLVESDEGGSFILMADNGHGVWRPSDARLTSLLLMTTREWYHASADAGLDDKVVERIARWAVSTARHKARADALASVSAVAGWLTESGTWPRGLTRARESDLNRPGSLFIGAPNGIVDLAEQRLLTRAEGRSKMVSRMITDDYDPDATHPDVDTLFSHLDPLDRAYILGSIGFGLRGRPSRRFFFLDGLGNDGKSTMANAVLLSMGDYTGVAMAQATFTTRHERPDSPSAYLLSFQEFPVVFIPEPPDANFNWGLIRRISGGDMVGARQPHAPVQIHRKAQFIATVFFYSNPDTRPVPPPMVTRAIYDRYRLVDYPHIPDTKIDEQLPTRLREKGARQALAALIIQHSMRHLGGPPADSPAVAINRRRVRRESLGESGEWMMSKVTPTGDASDRLTTDELWEAAVQAAAEGTGDGVTAWGMSRRQLTDYARLLFGVGPTVRGRVQGKVCHFWRRHKLLSDDEAHLAMDQRMDARMEAAAETPSVYALTYCRICHMLMLGVLETPHQAAHTEEEIGGQHPCFHCGTLLPAGQPFQLVCAACELPACEVPALEGLDTQTAVMAAIAAEMVDLKEGIAPHLQAQIALVQQGIQEVTREKAEAEGFWWPDMEEGEHDNV